MNFLAESGIYFGYFEKCIYSNDKHYTTYAYHMEYYYLQTKTAIKTTQVLSDYSIHNFH